MSRVPSKNLRQSFLWSVEANQQGLILGLWLCFTYQWEVHEH